MERPITALIPPIQSYQIECIGGPADGFEISMAHIPSKLMPHLIGMPVPAPNKTWYQVYSVTGTRALASYDGERSSEVTAIDDD